MSIAFADQNVSPTASDQQNALPRRVSAGKTGDRVVECLRSAIVDGAAGLADVPALVERVIREDLWRVRETLLDPEPRRFVTFAEFVRAAPPAGLGTTFDTLLRLCDGAPTALDLLITAMPNPGRGGDRRSAGFRAGKQSAAESRMNSDGSADNETNDFKRESATFEIVGTAKSKARLQPNRRSSRQYSLQRLRDKNSELYRSVLRGELSLNEALVAIQIRRPQLTVSATDPAAVAAALIKKFERSALEEIVAALQKFLQPHQD